MKKTTQSMKNPEYYKKSLSKKTLYSKKPNQKSISQHKFAINTSTHSTENLSFHDNLKAILSLKNVQKKNLCINSHNLCEKDVKNTILSPVHRNIPMRKKALSILLGKESSNKPIKMTIR